VDEVDAHYLEAGGQKVALGFIGALEEAVRHISLNPRSGSSRYGLELNLPDLRSWALKSYPHIVFYMEGRNRIDVWRVLHARRDIPEWIRESEPG
jgi:toxin ParE1/3/4